MTETVEIFGKKCGKNHPPLIVAELSGNHGGKIENALKMIEAAAETGADAVKIQSYTPDTITIDHDGPGFVLEKGLWKGRTLYDLYKEAHTPFEWHPRLFAKAREVGIPIFSSPFDDTAVDMLEGLDCPAYKIASFELVDIGLIEKVAKTGKPVIISTGMASLEEIKEAMKMFYSVNEHGDLILLHCTSGYPTPVSESNLSAIPVLANEFNIPVGLSDHTQGNAISIAAVALGSCVIEKHFILSKDAGGVDAEFSLDPNDFKQMVEDCDNAYVAIGTADFKVTDSESIHVSSRRSLYAVKDIAENEVLTKSNVRSIRPGGGLHPRELPILIGKKAKTIIKKGTAIKWSLIVD